MPRFGRSSAQNSVFWLFISVRKARSRRGESSVSRDFEELLESLNARRVRYLIGGAHALALHARPRATKDLDLFVAPTVANSKRFILALGDFFGGATPSYITVDALLDPNLIIQLGVAPVRVDVLSHFATLSFADAWRTRVDAKFGTVDAHYLGRAQLIAEKQHFDRPQDRADVAVLLERSGRTRVGRRRPALPKRGRRT
jgi:hypothetical protein